MSDDNKNKNDKKETYVMEGRHNETMEKMSRLNASLHIKLVEDQPMSKVQLTYTSRDPTLQGISGSISTLLAKRQKEEEEAKKTKGKERERPSPQKCPSTPIIIPPTSVLGKQVKQITPTTPVLGRQARQMTPVASSSFMTARAQSTGVGNQVPAQSTKKPKKSKKPKKKSKKSQKHKMKRGSSSSLSSLSSSSSSLSSSSSSGRGGQHNTRKNRHTKLDLPSPYDGIANMDIFDNWVFKVMGYMEVMDVSNKLMIKLLGSLLTGKANTFYMQYVALKQDKWTVIC